MNRTLKIMLGTIIILGATVGTEYVRSAFAEVAVIVNKTNSVTTVKKSVLERYFFRKTTKWDSGVEVMPIDLRATDPARVEFSDSFLGRSPREVEVYWISQSLVGGKSAPEVVNNSMLVKKYVASDSGAIGYINITDLDDSVKQVAVVD